MQPQYTDYRYIPSKEKVTIKQHLNMTKSIKYIKLLHSFWHAILYYTFAKHAKGYSIHSPFVFNLIRKVFFEAKEKSNITIAKKLRTDFIKNKTIIEQTNWGAGSRINNETKHSTIGKLTKQSSLRPKYISLLATMAKHYAHEHLLELGTCTGLTTTALAQTCRDAKIITIENAPTRARWAEKNFKKLQLGNIKLLQQDFSSALENLNRQKQKYDLVFIDGNHTYNATVEYFERLQSSINENGVIVFDDIYWSPEMTKAWQYICKTQTLGITIDLYRMGLLFRRDNQHKEHFTIRY